MSTWQQQPPPMGFYPPPQGAAGYPPQPGAAGYPPQPGAAGYPPQPGAAGYPPQPGAAGYPPQPGAYPSQQYPGAVPAGVMGGPAPYAAPPPVYGDTDYEDPFKNDANFQFSTKSIRHAFVRKVYAILMSQLLVTVGIILLFMYHQPTKNFVVAHPGAMFGAWALFFGLVIAFSCCESVRRKSPGNYICLLVLTLAMSYMMGAMAARYDTEAVLMAAGITTIVCFSLSVFAFQTKWDFTMLSGVLLVCAVVFFLFGIICIFIPGKTIVLVYSSLGVLLLSFYLVYDTQLMLGGNHKYSISPEEYIFAALNLYIDIMYIFLYILQIIGLTRD